ncbi:MAG: hypothetical protein ACJ8CR_36375, partial [Roseiflexaceae bacterium]
AQLTEKMMGAFNSVIDERAKHYHTYPQERPQASDVQAIITKYAAINAAISAGANLIPGPFGMAVAIPEIILIIRNQMAMIYDIGMAYNQQPVLRRELLAGIFISAAGVSGATLLTMHGGKVLVKRASLRVFQKVISLLAGKVTQQLLKSMISKWLPIVGAAAMAAWSNYSTHRIGKQAIAILSCPIEYISDAAEIVEPKSTQQPNTKVDVNFDILRIISLINLMKIDGRIVLEEVRYIGACIEQANISQADKIGLTQAIGSTDKIPVNYDVFANDPEEAVGLLIDLTALAKRDGNIHLSEKLYIKHVGALLGFSESDIEEMIASS